MWVYTVAGTIDDDELSAQLWDAGAQGLEERGPNLRAYFAAEQPLDLGGAWAQEPQRDWQAEWKASLRPVTAGRLTIVPTWLSGEVPPGQVPLIIEPGMAFGTGHHATTRMALEALGELELAGLHVLDVGTGSGVLALGAALLGARTALGLDIDPVTVPVAFENAVLNGFGPEHDGWGHPDHQGRLDFREGTLEGDQRGGHGLVIANLYAELHDLLMSDYRGALEPGGHLILTGILEKRLPLVRSALARVGFGAVTVRQDGEWVLVTARLEN